MHRCSIFVKTSFIWSPLSSFNDSVVPVSHFASFVSHSHFHCVCDLSALHIHAQLDVRITFFQGDVHTLK